MTGRALRLLIVVGILVVSAPAHADRAVAPDARAQAKAAFGYAMADYQRGAFREALDEFEHGYELQHDAAFLFNIAQCHRRLGERPEAVRYYLLFLDAKRDAPNRSEVRRYVKKLEAEIAAAPTSPPEEETAALPLVELVKEPTIAPEPPPRPTPVYRRWWVWTLVAVAVAGAGVGLGLGLTIGSPATFHATLPPFGPGAASGFAIRF